MPGEFCWYKKLKHWENQGLGGEPKCGKTYNRSMESVDTYRKSLMEGQKNGQGFVIRQTTHSSERMMNNASGPVRTWSKADIGIYQSCTQS